MEHWNNFKIKFHGFCDIEWINGERGIELRAGILDKKTNYEVVQFNSYLIGKTLEFSIITNEKMVKKLNLPTYKHLADPSYLDGKKYFGNKKKHIKKMLIPCLSLGYLNVANIIDTIIKRWIAHGYVIKRIYIERETGNSRRSQHRTYTLGNKYEYLKEGNNLHRK